MEKGKLEFDKKLSSVCLEQLKQQTIQEKDPLTWKFWKKRRYIVTFLLLLAFFNLYTARVDMSMALGIMLEGHEVISENGTVHKEYEFEWDDQTQGYILSSFFYGYLLTMFPGGVLAPIIGPHNLLGIGVGMGSVMTSLTPFAARQGLWLLLLNQVLIGAFGGVIIPCNQAMFSKWAPPLERSRMNMIAYSGEFLGMVIASYGSGVIGTYFGWEPIFYLFGTLGIMWWILWIFTVKDDPNKDKRCTKEEAEFITKSIGFKENETRITHPWKKIFTSVPFLGVVAAFIAHNSAFFSIITLLPKYIKEVHKINTNNVGILAAICYAISGVLAPTGGFIADKLQEKKLTTTQVRKYFTCLIFLIQIILFTLVANIDHWIVTPTIFITAASITVISWSGFAINVLDLAPKHSSVLIGISNTFGSLPGILCPMIAGYILHNAPEHFSIHTRWSFVFYIINSILLIGGGIYWFTASGELQEWAK